MIYEQAGNLSQPVWHWPFAPYGDGAKVTFNLRYPGQYYDSTTGLHYNHTHYFSPRTGRYLQPDLIGLEGGTNVYTYAGGNPVMFTDPTGTIWDLFDIGFILRWIGLIGLLGEQSPVRHPAKRRRIKTVIQELMYLAARLIRSGRRLKLRFSQLCPGFIAFEATYAKLAAG